MKPLSAVRDRDALDLIVVELEGCVTPTSSNLSRAAQSSLGGFLRVSVSLGTYLCAAAARS